MRTLSYRNELFEDKINLLTDLQVGKDPAAQTYALALPYAQSYRSREDDRCPHAVLVEGDG